ncbi:MAG: DUF4118 domain-containing protein [Magnetococcales bacterium]|nr:DUF4118 domain-containing protein [Magnetococcales bacterium]
MPPSEANTLFQEDPRGRPPMPNPEAVLVCVGPGPDSERLVRRAARQSGRTGAPWHAITIETPSVSGMPEPVRSRIFATLKLARDLGGETTHLTGLDPVAIAISHARKHRLGTLLVGRDRRRRLPWQHGFAEKLARLAPDLELLQVARDDHTPKITLTPLFSRTARNTGWRPHLLAILGVTLVTIGSTPLYGRFDPANIVMLFLLAVVFTALRYGRGAAVLSAFLSVAAFDFFFVPPRFAFEVHDAQYLVTFTVMLIVALVVGQLTAGLRFQVSAACEREQRMHALYEMSRDLSSAMNVPQIITICQRFIKRVFNSEMAVFVPGPEERLQLADGSAPLRAADRHMAQWSFDHGQNAGWGTDTLTSTLAMYVPLKAPTRQCGVLALVPDEPDWELAAEQQQLLNTSATLIAIALERIHYMLLAQDAQVRMASEQLRNTLLSAISHDLRTPLTVIAGLTDGMRLANPPLSEPHASLAEAMGAEVARTITMVNNLLDMARMQMGNVILKREWQTLEEVIGLSMGHCASLLVHHQVAIDLPADLPLVELDTRSMERVFSNLLENAAKHTPRGSRITLSAHLEGAFIKVSVTDDGPGVPPGMEQKLFEKFTRGHMESTVSGFGLGLAIVRTIIEAHGGSVWAENGPDGGAGFNLLLPLGEPPELPEEPDPPHVTLEPFP